MLSQDLLETEEARTALNMPLAKFELLISSGQLPIFRSSGRTCFRREDIAAIAARRKAGQAKALKVSEKPRAAAPVKNTNTAKKERDKYSVTRQTLTNLKSKTERASVDAKVEPTPKLQPCVERIDEDAIDDADDRTCSRLQAKRSTRGAWLVAGGAAVAIAVAALTFMSATSSVETPVAPQASGAVAFANCRAAPGLVESTSGERPLSFEVAGKLRAVYVEEGQTVKVGSLIAELENADLAAKLKSSQAGLSAAEAKLGILRGNLDSDLKKAESEVSRLRAELALLEPRQEDVEQARADARALEADAKRLAEDEQKYSDPKGRGTSWSVQLSDQARGLAEAAGAKLASAEARVRALEAGSRPEEKERMRAILSSAQAELARQKTTSPFQLQSAQAQADQCKAQVELAKAELERTRIMSAIDGTVVRKYMHPGEVIDALHSQPVVTVADMLNLRVRADVDEADFPRIQVGQHVRITADALGEGKFFSGTVEQVSHVTGQKRFSTGEAKERMDVKIVETIVKFDSPPPAKLVKLGLRVTALFEVAK